MCAGLYISIHMHLYMFCVQYLCVHYEYGYMWEFGMYINEYTV